MKPTTQAEYTKRIDREIAAVAASIEQERDLPSAATLANVANFSPFHFMRIYRALAGESLGATVQRLRLTRAAHLLAGGSAAISDVAGRVGFETPQAFARAFRQQFGCSPSETRASGAMKSVPPVAPVAPDLLAPQAAIRVDIVTLDPFRVVVLRNRGDFAKLDQAYTRLFAWMSERGALEAIAGIWGVPHHDPRDTPEAELLFDCCLATGAEVAPADGVALAELGSGVYLRHLYVGSYEHHEEVYDALLRQVLITGQWTLREAPSLREYVDDPETKPEAELRAHFYIPVAALA